MGSTRAERAATTRHKLLDAAVEQFLRKPYDEVSIHDIATGAGVAYGLVAHHFGNKRGIHQEVLRELARRLELEPPPPGPAAKRIRQMAHTHFAAIEQYPVAYVGLMLGADPESRAIFDASRQQALQLASEVLGLDPELPVVRVAVRACLAAADEAAVVWLQEERPFPLDDLIEMLMATMAEMLRQVERTDPSLDVAQALSALTRSD